MKYILIAALTALAGGGALLSLDTQDNALESHTPEAQYTGNKVIPPAANDILSSNELGLNEQEIEWLLLMREEEKLAHDVYTALYEKWQLPVFANIADSEQTHTNRVRDLLTSYDIADPVAADAQAGEYTNLELTQLYAQLLEQGSQSLAGALEVGATIEDLDIADLDIAMKVTDNPDILAVYANLQKGSRNHLRSFNQLLVQETTESYSAQHISPEALEAIINSPRERGRTN